MEELSEEEALQLLQSVTSVGNLGPDEKREWVSEVLDWWKGGQLNPGLEELVRNRAKRLEEAHLRVRRLIQKGRVSVEPQFPPDLLGIYVLLPA